MRATKHPDGSRTVCKRKAGSSEIHYATYLPDGKPTGVCHINTDDYREAPDGTPRYFPIRGIMCRAIWENGELVICTDGRTGAETVDGAPYFSPLLWALLDYEQCTSERKTPGKLENPCIQGNTPQKAKELVFHLIRENRGQYVNDSFGGYVTPLMLALDDEKIWNALLMWGADSNRTRYLDGTTLLYHAAKRGDAVLVGALLRCGANPTFESNPQLDTLLSKGPIEKETDLNMLKCRALISLAQAKWQRERGK